MPRQSSTVLIPLPVRLETSPLQNVHFQMLDPVRQLRVDRGCSLLFLLYLFEPFECFKGMVLSDLQFSQSSECHLLFGINGEYPLKEFGCLIKFLLSKADSS